MKILCAFHGSDSCQLNDAGGIINHQEHLTRSFQALGHEVDACILVWKSTIAGVRAAGARGKKQERGALGMEFDQHKAWFWPASKRRAYKGMYNLNRWKAFATKFDLIIWQMPVVTKQRDHRGNTDWLELYNVPVKQLAVIHDGNLADGYPWIYAVRQHLTALVAVHPCAYRLARRVPIPSVLIPNPHFEALERCTSTLDTASRKGWLSVQTFKAWKHVADLVRAVPYQHSATTECNLAGGGLEYYYMTSETKVKEQYLANRKYDPDLDPKYEGQRIWNLALSAGMDYHGYLTNFERDAAMKKVRFLIDPSWNKKYAAIGDHFNRTPIEGIINGCVPIGRNLGIAAPANGKGELFIAGLNYEMIPYDATPKQFGQRLDEIMSMSEGDRERMLYEGRKLLPQFEGTTVAQRYIDVAQHGVKLNDCSFGEYDEDLRRSSDLAIETFFGDKAPVAMGF